ncbi:type I-MYXAN CRISPR-associated protein Cas6/Cmx6 [Lamprobacter modestohalophilus]|uniref:type I-MYXAN CRISPR-associated protein Cas6/Cmx6 n=1 Tax=Lamprobacter modestohalophilus TaxID=1064514 RepID=UPI002ADEC278|nr:type I-MYXAN CRISPR-associated protein Cas6/Cmx6 [Lamprobacter modestohalophilus]MEA1049303.1 type I-MYXAN CRISPR-associated protein Cas6/Cmx6 [Lamprobacter modestohalophilus]
MFWQESDPETHPKVPNDVVDVMFALQHCKSLPVDHAHALANALIDAVPWLAEEPRTAIHTIHVAGSQNGWERPAHDSEQQLLPSRRTKLGIRIPRARLDELKTALEGRTLEIRGSSFTLGPAKERPLSAEKTLFARYVVAHIDEDEDQFLRRVAGELAQRGIKIRKALCGKALSLSTPAGPVLTRSLMLAELSLDDAIALQQQGIGDHQTMGCGIFLPHKGIEAVAQAAS